MTSKQLRSVLRRVRDERGWTYAQLAADIHAINGFRVVSESTVRNFCVGSPITPRIHEAIERYVLAGRVGSARSSGKVA